MVRIFYKNHFSIYKKEITRFVVIILLTAISIALVTAIGVLPSQIRVASETLTSEWLINYANFIADGIERISYIFPVMFIIVSAMVVFMTLTRLIEKDRTQIGCMVTLGYSKLQVSSKYLIFTLSSNIIGSIIGILIGAYLINPVLFDAIARQVRLSDAPFYIPYMGIIFSVILIGLMFLVTLITTQNVLNQQPSEIIRGKAIKIKDKSILEKLPFWSLLPYKYKSTTRNIFRYKIRLVMTLFSVSLSTILVFAGFSLMFVLNETNPEMNDVIGMISLIIVVAAVLLDTLVIYNITNINIDERKKEIATLKVLGYKEIEVAGYIFREIMIIVLLGITIGLPLGYGSMHFIFEFLNFGNIEYLRWYVWIISGIITLVSLGLAVLFLFNKIRKVNMNDSLKVLE